MKKYNITHLPENFSRTARLTYKCLEGNLYAIGNQLVFTDEADDVEAPRARFDNYEELENWLIATLVDWLAEGKDDPMFEDIENALGRPV